ncbi:sugar ABC transporter substrate-binding protein [Conexibacter sp. SYSU D00693]|uniref:sugar ABC transporter substrate-binding protein n=1 Tax=Conexibacter sp. SYSU D00693 TaxID=2812560 RepID=UPI00196B5B8C|nr:sugar ABC transporter substrate-binding protein [Conexibacter sp. SYSU D00693]
MTTITPSRVLAALLACAAVAAAGCGDDDDSGGSGGAASTGGSGEAKQVALLLPESKTARYEAADRPLFTAKLKADCPDCELIYSNADQDASKQQQQAEAAITRGADVLVLDPVDSQAASTIATRAKQSNIPVIAYDRLINDADIDYYISFDNEQVGKLQGEALLKALGSPQGKQIVMINGAPTDNNAKLFKAGAHSVLDDSGVKVGKEYDTPDWSPDKAQTQMEQAITALGKGSIDGVYAANDGTAGGAIAAMKSAGIDPKDIPVTGQDSEVAAIQRILAGEQHMTIYKAVKPEAEAAATLALALARGEQAPSGLVNGETDNGQEQVPSVLLKPVAVTKDNVADTVIKDQYVKTSDVCKGSFAKACTEAGIS